MVDDKAKKFGDEFNSDFIRKNRGNVSQFFIEGRYRYNETHQPALCQLKGCKEPASWIQNLKKTAILLCFKHHEQLSHDRKR